jgi:hypothetical protein
MGLRKRRSCFSAPLEFLDSLLVAWLDVSDPVSESISERNIRGHTYIFSIFDPLPLANASIHHHGPHPEHECLQLLR